MKRLVILGLAGVVLLAVSIGFLLQPKHPAVKVDPGPDAEAVAEAKTKGTVWTVEDGQIAWRPMNASEKVAVAIFSFGTALNAPFVQGRLMPEADVTSFRGLSRNYGIEKNAVWYRGEVLAGADPKSFRAADFGFGWDDRTIWQGRLKVMDNPSPGAELVAATATIYSLGEQTYYLDQPMDEAPEGPIVYFCKSWFEMNGALWLKADRLAGLGPGARMVACDGSIFSRGGVEDISENEGLLLADGPMLLRFRLDGSQAVLQRFQGDIAFAEPVDPVGLSNWLLVVQLASGEAFALDPKQPAAMQSLGTQPPANPETALARRGELWLGQELFLLLDKNKRTAGRYLRAVGHAEILGDYLLLADGIYFRGEHIASPGDLPVQLLSDTRILVGDMCFSFSSYVSDLPKGDPQALATGYCDANRPPNPMYYAGLEIGFQGKLKLRKRQDADGLYLLRLGRVVLHNPGPDTISLDEAFVQSLQLLTSIGGKLTALAAEHPVADSGRFRLGPGEELSWPVDVRSPKTRLLLGYVLKGAQLPDHAAVLGTAEQVFGYGQVGSN